MGISTGLDIALRALLAQQAGVDTASHNIANVATPGYSRQRVRLQAIPGSYFPQPASVPGMGVEVISVERVRDLFIDFQIRAGNHAAGRYAARAQSLQRAELALGEPGDSGLRATMSQYWNAWRDLANAPDSTATRTVVIQAGETLAFTARRIRGSLVELRDEADQRILSAVAEINALTTEIASLNGQIVPLAGAGNDAGDLHDQRDLALDRLSTLIDIDYRANPNDAVNVTIGGRSLVRASTAFAIYGDPNVANNNYVDLKFVADDGAVTVTDGAIQGLFDQRDTELTARIADLDTLVGQIITDVNTAHAAGRGLDGSTGNNFFSGVDASDIAVNAAIVADSNLIAAATNWDPVSGTPPGDGSNASIISDLQYAQNLLGATATYDGFYEGFVSAIGATTREAERLTNTQSLMLMQLEQVRQSAAGVNLDEEMVQLMRFQRAYEAAARVVSVVDEMLDTLINRMI